MAARTAGTSSCPALCFERAGPGEEHARRDTPPLSIGRRTGRLRTNATSRRRHDGVRSAPERIRSERGGARLGWAGAGILPRVREGSVREDLPNDGGIVQRGDQAQAATIMGHASTSIPKARCMRAAQVQAGGWTSLRPRPDLRPAAPSRPWAPAPISRTRPRVPATGRAEPTHHGR
jgi:hypothetical protein